MMAQQSLYPPARRTRTLRARSARQRGVVIVIAVFSTFLIAGMIGYVFNTGRHAQLRTETQNAADATAIGGAGFIARSFNTVAMNNVEISRLIATVQLLDAMPLAVEYTLIDQEAQLESIERTLSRGLGDRAWLGPELRDERARLIAKIQALEEMDQFLNHSGYDMRRMTFYDGPEGRGELWKAMESLDAISTATMEHVGGLSQHNAAENGMDNMHFQGESSVAFMAPFEPHYLWSRHEFDDFYNPVIRGIVPDETDDELTRRGPYDTIFGWHSLEWDLNPDGFSLGDRTPPTNVLTTPANQRPRFASGGRPGFDDGSRSTPPPPTLVGYTPYGPWTWLSLQLRNELETDFEAAGRHDVNFNDTGFFIRAFGMAMVKMRYLWPQASFDQLSQLVFPPTALGHPISNQFLEPQWVTRYSEAEAIVRAGRPRIAYARWMILDYVHEEVNGRPLTRFPQLIDRRITDPRPRPGQRRWAVDPPAVNALDRIGQYVWRDAPDETLEWTDQQGNRHDARYYRYFVWLGINVGPLIEIRNPNPVSRSDRLPAPIDFIHDEMPRPSDDEPSRPGEPFSLLGVAKQPSTAPMWPELFQHSGYDGHVAIAQAGVFNNHSWDLWTQMWHAQLEPVQDFAGWAWVMRSSPGGLDQYPGLDADEAENVIEYLRSVEGLAPILLNH